MSRRKENLVDLILFFVVLAMFVGVTNATKMFMCFLKMFNAILISSFNTSVFTYLFKYSIAFSIVGLILYMIGSPRSKLGHYTGKVLYFIIGSVVGFVLDLLARIFL